MSKNEIRYSDGRVIKNPVIQVWDDLHTERSGMFRAFWCRTGESTTGSPVIGYCSPGGSRRTVAACVREALSLYPGQRFIAMDG